MVNEGQTVEEINLAYKEAADAAVVVATASPPRWPFLTSLQFFIIDTV